MMAHKLPFRADINPPESAQLQSEDFAKSDQRTPYDNGHTQKSDPETDVFQYCVHLLLPFHDELL